MMTLCIFFGRINSGCGHDGMTRAKMAENCHHPIKPACYDHMTKVSVFRTRVFYIKSLLFYIFTLTRISKEYNHIVISVLNHWMMTLFQQKNSRHIVIG